MSLIIMARGEDGLEFRPNDKTYVRYEDAYADMPELRENYPEATMWVEEKHDSVYYARLHRRRYENDEGDLY